MNEKIYQLAKECLGRDIAATQHELGCAEAVSYVLNGVGVKDFPRNGYLSTADMYIWLKRFAVRVESPVYGDIIISPTGTSEKGYRHGHVGIVAKHGVLSNNSMNGLWQEYYTLTSWDKYYNDRLGFPVIFFRIK